MDRMCHPGLLLFSVDHILLGRYTLYKALMRRKVSNCFYQTTESLPRCSIGPASTVIEPVSRKWRQVPDESQGISRPGDSAACMSSIVHDVGISPGNKSSWTAYRSLSSVEVILRIERMKVRSPAGPYSSIKG